MELLKFKELCKALANKMEYELVDRQNQCNNFSIKKDDSHIVLSELYNNKCVPGKLTISGEYPRNCKGEYYPPEQPDQIRVSMKKSIDQIVKDIKRRFLPKHLENLTKIKEKITLLNKYYDEKQNLLMELCQYTKILPAKHREYTIHRYADSKVFEFVAKGKNFDIELSGITLEQAKRIWDIIK